MVIPALGECFPETFRTFGTVVRTEFFKDVQRADQKNFRALPVTHIRQRHAQMSKGGRSIIALYSTAMVKDKATGERHEVSKIVAQLQRGAAVSLSRNDVDIVITEYGAADLRGANIRQRVEALISIAHPKFRDELWDQALACGIIGKR